MAAIVIRNLSPETHRALQARAARHGRSTEAEARTILDEAVRPTGAGQAGVCAGRARPAVWRARPRHFARRDPGGADRSRMILLDTNVVSEPMRQCPTAGCRIGSTLRRSKLFFFRRSAWPNCCWGSIACRPEDGERALAAALEVANREPVRRSHHSSFDIAAAEAYAKVVTRARGQGHPISVADGQIAAIAASRGLSVAIP